MGGQGEVRDRTAEGRHFRMEGLNLLVAVVIYWNAARMGEAVEKCRAEGIGLPDEHLAHQSPLGWAHIHQHLGGMNLVINTNKVWGA